MYNNIHDFELIEFLLELKETKKKTNELYPQDML